MCEKRLISAFDLKDGITSGVEQANPQNEIDARLKQKSYDIPVSNEDIRVKCTVFLFIMEDTGDPVAGLNVIIESKDGIGKGKTDTKGRIIVPFDKEAPYRLLNEFHPDYTGSKQLDAADVVIDFTYENCLNFAGKEKKDLSYIKSWDKVSEVETEDSYVPMKQLKIQTGDTLSKIVEKEYPSLEIYRSDGK